MRLDDIPFSVYLIWFGLVGAAAGSFFHVCVYRIPRGISTVTPASHCPVCQTELKWFDNLPLLSYLLSGARCRYCRAPIPVRYFLYEVSTSAAFMGIFWVYGLTFTTFVYLSVTSILIIGSGIDLDHYFIPDFLSIPMMALSVMAAGWVQHSDRFPGILVNSVPDALLGIAVGGGVVWGVRIVGGVIFQQEAMGFGDVKHLAGIGGFLGWDYVLLCFFLASLYASIIGLTLKLTGKIGKYGHIPFIPYLSLGAYSAFLFGKPLIKWYFAPFSG